MFGAKYVDLIYPDEPSRATYFGRCRAAVAQRQHRGEHRLPEPRRACLDKIDPAKLNAVLDRAGGRRARPGRAHRRGHHRRQPGAAGDSIRGWTPCSRTGARSRDSADAYSAAAHDILATLDAASTTSATDHHPCGRSGCVAAQHDRILRQPASTYWRPTATIWYGRSTCCSQPLTC